MAGYWPISLFLQICTSPVISTYDSLEHGSQENALFREDTLSRNACECVKRWSRFGEVLVKFLKGMVQSSRFNGSKLVE